MDYLLYRIRFVANSELSKTQKKEAAERALRAESIMAAIKQGFPSARVELEASLSMEEPILWVELNSLREIVFFLAKTPRAPLDRLEGVFAHQVESTIVLSYFFSASSDPRSSRVILRVSATPVHSLASIDVPSLCAEFSTALAFESELSSLFGIHFESGVNASSPRAGVDGRPLGFLVNDRDVYPLRKEFQVSGGGK